LADGKTADVRAVDAMPPGLDPSAAVTAAEAWTFEPAREDGAPIDWHNNAALVVFSRANAEHDGSLEFAEAYEEVAELIRSGRLEDARSRNDRMQREYAVTFEEIELAQMQLAAIDHALADPQAALAAIRRATEPAIANLGEDELKLALEHRFALELELGLASDALQTFERRAELAPLAPRQPLERQGTVLRQALAVPETAQAVRGRIAANGLWEYALPWPIFEVADVQGRAEGLHVECHRKTELPFQPNVQMTIPSSWGRCVLAIRGQPETTFTLYEFLEPTRRKEIG
jgi:tetratricopeptide (TPR) repeat protein